MFDGSFYTENTVNLQFCIAEKVMFK